MLLGVGADALLGATLPPAALDDPTLNSQNRFYGTSYWIYGMLIWLYTRDTARYAVIFHLLLAMTFVGGLTRIVSVAINGWPSPPILLLSAVELILPPLLLLWQRRSDALSQG